MPVDAEYVREDRIAAVGEKDSKPMENSGWQVEVDGATPEEWSQMLDLFADANIYQSYTYGEIRWGAKALSHLVLKHDGEVLAIAQVRIVRPTPLKFGIAYLRWGPLCERRDRPVDPTVFAQMARALEEEYAGKRRLFIRVLPNAFSGSPRAAAIQSAFEKFHQEPLSAENTYRTIVLDLAPTLDELRKSLDKKWRNQLTRSEKNNLEVVVGNGMEEYQSFCLIYDQMQKRKAFDTTVNVEEFGRIQKNLPETQRMRILICKDQGRPVTALVASAMGDSAIYLLGATSDDGLNSKGAYLLHWTLIKELKERGIRWYDLGGIDPEANPGVYHFKRGFSGEEVSHINPLVASGSAVSSAAVRAGLAMQHLLRASKGSLNFARGLKQLATRS